MYYIYNNDNESLYAGTTCGCIVWKRHYTRAVSFDNILMAKAIVNMFDAEYDLTVVPFTSLI